MLDLNITNLNLFALTSSLVNARTNIEAENTLMSFVQVFNNHASVNRVSCSTEEMQKNTENCLGNIITNPNKPIGNESNIGVFYSVNSPYSMRTGRTILYLKKQWKTLQK